MQMKKPTERFFNLSKQTLHNSILVVLRYSKTNNFTMEKWWSRGSDGSDFFELCTGQLCSFFNFNQTKTELFCFYICSTLFLVPGREFLLQCGHNDSTIITEQFGMSSEYLKGMETLIFGLIFPWSCALKCFNLYGSVVLLAGKLFPRRIPNPYSFMTRMTGTLNLHILRKG